MTALLVYVYDIIVKGNDLNGMESLKNRLMKEFEIKELGKLKYFLGIEVAYSEQGIFISKQKYVIDLLKKNQASYDVSQQKHPESTNIDLMMIQEM